MKSRYGLVSLITGILAFLPLLAFILYAIFLSSVIPIVEPYLSNILIFCIITGFILAGLAITFGIIGAVKEENKTMAIIGIILGSGTVIFQIVFFIILWLMYLVFLSLAVTLAAMCGGCGCSDPCEGCGNPCENCTCSESET
ncbi:MAG: hypothetical protein ACFFBP_22085 [Promethearchaeota archaeon]